MLLSFISKPYRYTIYTLEVTFTREHHQCVVNNVYNIFCFGQNIALGNAHQKYTEILTKNYPDHIKRELLKFYIDCTDRQWMSIVLL